MRTFNRHQNNHITEPGKVPTTPHFVVLVFDTFSYESPGYDRGDPSYTSSVQTISYYAFLDRAGWESMIREYTQECILQGKPAGAFPQIVAFHSGGAGQIKTSIEISVAEAH